MRTALQAMFCDGRDTSEDAARRRAQNDAALRSSERSASFFRKLRIAVSDPNLTAPAIFSGEAWPDVNTVAEYLDCQLETREQIERYEDACFNDSELLAEVGDCYDVLNIRQRESRPAPPSCRRRLYYLAKEEDVRLDREPEPVSPPEYAVASPAEPVVAAAPETEVGSEWEYLDEYDDSLRTASAPDAMNADQTPENAPREAAPTERRKKKAPAKRPARTASASLETASGGGVRKAANLTVKTALAILVLAGGARLMSRRAALEAGVGLAGQPVGQEAEFVGGEGDDRLLAAQTSSARFHETNVEPESNDGVVKTAALPEDVPPVANPFEGAGDQTDAFMESTARERRRGMRAEGLAAPGEALLKPGLSDSEPAAQDQLRY